MLEIRRYDEQAKRALTEARGLLDRAERETRELSADEETRFHALHDEAERAVKMRERLKEQERIESDDLEQREARRRRVAEREQNDPETRKSEYRSAFFQYVRGGVQSLSLEQRATIERGAVQIGAEDMLGALGPEARVLGTAVGATPFGGFAIPEDFSGRIERTMKQFAAVLNAPISEFTTSGGGPFQWPTSDDTAQSGELLAEGSPAATQDVVLGRVTFGSYTYSSKIVLVQNQLLMDEEANLTSVLAEALGERIGRISGLHFTTGNGTSQPQGITVGATDSGITPAWSAATWPAGITADALIDLAHTVDPAWRSSAAFGYMFSDAAFKAIRKLKTSGSGEPIWQLGGLSREAPATILGYGYTVNNDMPAGTTAAQRPVIVGDLSRFRVRRVGRVILMRLNERYAEFLQTAFLAFWRTDSKVTQATAIKAVVMAA